MALIVAVLFLVAGGLLLARQLMNLSPSATPIAREPFPSASGSASPSPSPTHRRSSSPRPTPTAKPSASAKPSAIVGGTAHRTSIALVATYDVAVTFRFDDRSVAGVSTITIHNASGGPIDRVELNTVMARIGGLRVGGTTVDGRLVNPSVKDQTVIVPLGGSLRDGGTTRIQLAFRATLRADLIGSDWLFTRTNGIVNANRWLPWVSLQRPFDRPNYGDPFITASSPLVRVRITTDRPLVIAATGERVASAGLVQTFEARNVRDFNFTASPLYRVHEAKAGAITIRLYSLDGYPDSTVLGYATDAVARMGPLVGPYPYKTFSVAQSAGGDGMESPELIWIPGGLGGRQLHWLVYHETAHQWFYGMVGSDQANQPFADEAAADQLARHVSGLWRASTCGLKRLDLSIYEYSSGCYFEIIYVQGSQLLDSLRTRIGDAVYWRAMRDYVAAHRYGLGSTSALLANLQAHTTVNLRPMLAPRFPSLY